MRMKNEKPVLSDNEINIILNINSENVNKVIEIAERLAREFENIPASKMRDFYDYVIKVDDKESNWYTKLAFLKPKMAYNVGKETNRQKKEALSKFNEIFSKIIDEINNDLNKFKKFKIFFEALVAYHKIYAKSQ
ncbi:type III-A CRISPR-associated protein Csm2 [Methanotorris formicicus]|uniref:CRISPR system Cms protein Csm2 n=1 Tax=Methanotorris formicicus Mc-S-70 TaxID=647171 RepID=H1KYT1_9EURY|nr:type III-A CRISPR-associated protein Csm2 [Methanotorris formicicus]EHP86828.1 CRISPR-associated protein, Csm2 family [Methanotorris formicicus Mc-S-70]